MVDRPYEAPNDFVPLHAQPFVDSATAEALQLDRPAELDKKVPEHVADLHVGLGY